MIAWETRFCIIGRLPHPRRTCEGFACPPRDFLCGHSPVSNLCPLRSFYQVNANEGEEYKLRYLTRPAYYLFAFHTIDRSKSSFLSSVIFLRFIQFFGPASRSGMWLSTSPHYTILLAEGRYTNYLMELDGEPPFKV